MTILKTNAANDLRIVKYANGAFTVQCFMENGWYGIADPETLRAANASFKSFGG